MLRKSIALLMGITAAIMAAHPAIARPMTSQETAFLGQLNRLPDYQSLLQAGATKKAVIDMGWAWCEADDLTFQLMTKMQWLAEGNAASTRENLVVSLVGGALAMKHLCPERRSAYGEALNTMVGYSVKGRQRLWDLTR
jgi:hypothetical protein